jgi:hypothetical protein
MQFYLLRDGEQTGPFSIDQMQLWWRVGMLDSNQLFWKEGMEAWEPLSVISALLEPERVKAADPLAESLKSLAVRWVQVGEYAIPDLRLMMTNGAIPAGAEYWNESVKAWRPVAGILGIAAPVTAVRAPMASVAVRPMAAPVRGAVAGGEGAQQKNVLSKGAETGRLRPARPDDDAISPCSRSTYVVLGVFLGMFGVHNLYAGHYWRALFEVIITVCMGVMLLVGWFESPYWAFVVYLFVVLELFDEDSDGRGRQFQ